MKIYVVTRWGTGHFEHYVGADHVTLGCTSNQEVNKINTVLAFIFLFIFRKPKGLRFKYCTNL